jgi:hypothetical protein
VLPNKEVDPVMDVPLAVGGTRGASAHLMLASKLLGLGKFAGALTIAAFPPPIPKPNGTM